jgi:hypothetical protein
LEDQVVEVMKVEDLVLLEHLDKVLLVEMVLLDNGFLEVVEVLEELVELELVLLIQMEDLVLVDLVQQVQ